VSFLSPFLNSETFEKRFPPSAGFKIKAYEDFSHPRGIGYAFHGADRNTLEYFKD
jgi:hypothetical protein